MSTHRISKRARRQPVFTRSRMLASTSYVGKSERESCLRKVVSNAMQHNKHKKMPEELAAGGGVCHVLTDPAYAPG